MNTPVPIIWPGQSGQKYRFNIYIREWSPGKWHPIYIGQTGDLNQRQKQGYKKEQIDKAGATHICVHVNSAGESARLDEEEDLIALWQPECNDQHIRKDAPRPTTRQASPLPQSILGLKPKR